MEKQNLKSSGLGDISMIRDILMGQQINDFDQRFTEIADRIAALEKDLRSSIQMLDDRTETHFVKHTNEFNEKLEKLRHHLDNQVDMLKNKIENTSKTDKASLSKLLVEMSQKIMSE